MTMKELTLEDINGSIDDVSIVKEAEDAIREIVQTLSSPAHDSKGSLTLSIKIERVQSGDVVRAVGDVTVKLPKRVREGVLLFGGDDGVVRTNGHQYDIEGLGDLVKGSTK